MYSLCCSVDIGTVGRIRRVPSLIGHQFDVASAAGVLAAVQHERAPRPSTVASQHQLALHKLGYHFSRSSVYPPPSASPYAAPPPDLVHSAFLEAAPFHSFPRVPDVDMTLLHGPIGPLGGLNPFKIPLFSTSLHYPLPHPGYFPSNIFYPPSLSTDGTVTSADQVRSKFLLNLNYLVFSCGYLHSKRYRQKHSRYNNISVPFVVFRCVAI